MGFFVLILLIFVFESVFHIHANELVTVWAPKTFIEGCNYNLFFLSSEINESLNPKLSVQFRKRNITAMLERNKFGRISFQRKFSVGKLDEIGLIFTHFRELKNYGRVTKQCITKEIKIKTEKRPYFTFIQTDKPIYSPGHVVKFRVLVLGRDLKPYHVNNLNIEIIDPLNRSIKEFNDPDDAYLGVFTNSFTLSSSTPLGDWKITVVVDKIQYYKALKVFAVQKYTLPPFEVKIVIDEKHILDIMRLKFSFYAQYAFGEMVTGNVKVIIKDIKNGRVYSSKSFPKINGIKELVYDVRNDLGIIGYPNVDLNIHVEFTEPESGITIIKAEKIHIHHDSKNIIKATHDSNFIPGFPFNLNVFVTKWNGESIEDKEDLLNVRYIYTNRNRESMSVNNKLKINQGKAVLNVEIPKDVIGFKMELDFANSKGYTKVLQIGESEMRNQELYVDYEPKIPKLNEKVKIFVKSSEPIDSFIYAIMTRYGNVDSNRVDCSSEFECSFDLIVKEEMIPSSSIMVYAVKDFNTIQTGKVNVKTDIFGKNYLNLTLPSRSKPKEKIPIGFNTLESSTIYLLAFDKRLSYLRSGNDIKSEDISNEVGRFDDINIIYKSELKRWEECSAEELNRVESGALHSLQSTPDLADTGEGNDLDIPIFDDRDLLDQVEEQTEDGLMREYFPETWIFEDFNINDNEFVEKLFTVPDSITSWIISAFSVSKNEGIALAPTMELLVKNEFFIKTTLPYSLRYKEVLRLDILVYNYVNSKKTLQVNIELSNIKDKMLKILENGDSCRLSRGKQHKSVKNVQVPSLGVKRVSFYIQANSEDDENYQKFMTFQIVATAKDELENIYKDVIKKSLRVDPIGVKTFHVLNNNYNLNGNRVERLSITAEDWNKVAENRIQEFPKISVVVGGDYLTEKIDMDSRYEFFPSDCLEQKTSKFKGNVEYFRYMKSKNRQPATYKFSDYYQSLLHQRTKNWHYATTTGYRGYFIEAVASAMELDALPKNEIIIQKELDSLAFEQAETGEFNNFGSFPEINSHGRENAAKFFKTSFILIPFLKHRAFVKKNYDGVISNGFKFLKSIRARINNDYEGYSIAAYAYALNGNKNEAEQLLSDLENARIEIERHKKCYKISRAHTKCDMRHTSYAAIAYLELNQGTKANPLINWLLDSYNLNKYYSNTHPYAIATEAIAKIVSRLQKKVADFTVQITNEDDFSHQVHITQENMSNPVEIDLPDYSLQAEMSISGSGFCSITTIVVNSVILKQISPKFQLTVQTSGFGSTKIVKVCAVYKTNAADDLSSLFNVIFDVDIPTGYIYDKIIDLHRKGAEIELVTPTKKNSRVVIYYNDFVRDKNYCVDIRTIKAFDVKYIQKAGVQVYDYNKKENVAVEFYSFASNEC